MSEIIDPKEVSRLAENLGGLSCSIEHIIALNRNGSISIHAEPGGEIAELVKEVRTAARSMELLAQMVDKAMSSHRAAWAFKDSVRAPLKELVAALTKASQVAKGLLERNS